MAKRVFRSKILKDIKIHIMICIMVNICMQKLIYFIVLLKSHASPIITSSNILFFLFFEQIYSSFLIVCFFLKFSFIWQFNFFLIVINNYITSLFNSYFPFEYSLCFLFCMFALKKKKKGMARTVDSINISRLYYFHT